MNNRNYRRKHGHSALGQPQRQDEASYKLFQWIEQGKVLTPQELSGLPKQLNNQFRSLQILDANLCRRFESGEYAVVLQQIVTLNNDARNLIGMSFLTN